MTEVCFCGGGTAHGWNNSTCVSLGAPLPPYIKEQGGRPAGPSMVRLGCNPTRNRIAILFLVGTTKEGREGKEKGGRWRPPILVQLGTLGGAPASPYGLPLSFP